MIVTVTNHDPGWAAAYAEEALRIRKILGEKLVNVFHIGSTAVPGLKTKPILDIMPVVENIGKVDDFSAEFEAAGYEVMGEFGMPGRRYFRRGGDNRTHQLHAFQYDNVFDIERHLALRDYLREHAAAREDYGRLKAALAECFPGDIESYCREKDSFVKALEKEALKWRWKTAD